MYIRSGTPLAAAFLIAASVVLGGEANAAYMYTVTPAFLPSGGIPPLAVASTVSSSASTTVGAPGTTLQLIGKTGIDLNTVNDISLADLLVSKSVLTSSTDNFTQDYVLNVTLTNPQLPSPAAQSATFQILGTLTVSASTSPSGQTFSIDNVYREVVPVGPQSIGGLDFSVYAPLGIPPSQYFGKPTLNQSPGSLSARITAIPEPASLVLLGLGGLALTGFGLRRCRRVAS